MEGYQKRSEGPMWPLATKVYFTKMYLFGIHSENLGIDYKLLLLFTNCCDKSRQWLSLYNITPMSLAVQFTRKRYPFQSGLTGPL